tara:strand:+ start:175 stop:525 length:351 start_codon:yes stop_codon:yes gene_type:complete
MFEYLLNKIEKSHFLDEPFRMIYIEDFFSESHFQKIISSMEIDLPGSKDDYEIFEHLFNAGYKIISFPGCITDKNKYINSRIKKSTQLKIYISLKASLEKKFIMSTLGMLIPRGRI